MKRRDLGWRVMGLGIVAAAGAVGPGHVFGSESWQGLTAFVAALFGVALIVQGRRVPASLRIEGSRHRALPQAIRQRIGGGR
ncbi:MAG: hypothetical protein WC804_00435 [Sphingomonas sp.]|jgi:hypothetical protein|uniref:hypothetical protein n=1 Tax=Sphingomonas sp. TaxID=28214 RepID=UPI0035664265